MSAPATISGAQLQRIRMTAHAVERFAVRMRPGLPIDEARRELERLIGEFGELTLDPPARVRDRSLQSADCYLLVGDDLVLPMVEAPGCPRGEAYVAVTTLVRGCISDAARARRNAGRRQRHRRR